MSATDADQERAAEVARGLTERERSVMRSFAQWDVYAINFPRDRVKSLESAGLLEWLPPVWGNANNWGATPLGRLVAAELEREENT